MSAETIAHRSAAPVAVNPPAIAWTELAPWALFVGVLLLTAYVVGMAQDTTLHELAHDGRHLLGFPCH